MSRGPTFTERRRALLGRRVDSLEIMEKRAMVSESLGIMMLGIGVPAATAAFGSKPSDHQTAMPHKPGSRSPKILSTVATPKPHSFRHADGGSPSRALPAAAAQLAMMPDPGDWLTLSRPEAGPGASGGRLAIQPQDRTGSGGGAESRGGGSPGAGAGAITPLRLPPPTAPNAGGPAGIILAAPGAAAPAPVAGSPSTVISAGPGDAAVVSPGSTPAAATPGGAAGYAALRGPSGGTVLDSIFSLGAYTATGNSSPASQGSFTHFPLYTVDYYAGLTLFPGVTQFGTLDGYVDLRAQARDATGVTFSWDTTGLTDAISITGTSTYNLKFRWGNYRPSPGSDSVTLTATDGGGHQEVQTYTFGLPAGSVGTSSGGAPAANWPQSLPPDTVLPNAPTFATHNATVDANSGALNATIPLPAYNPNLPALALTYDSLAADPRPIIVAPHTIDPALSVPAKVSAQLTLNGAAGTTYYYDTSQFTAGDIQQVALQADATALATGRYSYTITLGDIRGTTTTTTINGAATVLNGASNAFGAGWSLRGLERIIPASGGVILDAGSGGDALWFSGGFSGGGTYTSPAGDFSALAKSGSGGAYTRTMADGTVYRFNSGGQQTSVADRNGLRVTFAYDSGGKLATVTDPYSKVTTFAYDSGGKLATVTDPASRVATFAHTGSNLTAATLPDAGAWSYGYDGSGRLTQIIDPNSKTTSVAYNAAQRASTITRPDGTTEAVSSYQERGWTNSGTSGSPASATLLAESRSSFTDALGHTTSLRPDWNGRGLTNVATDPDGNVAMFDRTPTGLATVAVDRINRITRYGYDAKGNVTLATLPDGNTESAAYNSFSEPTTSTDANGHATTITFDGNGNPTVVRDPLNNLTTMTYTGNGKLATVKDARLNVTTYQYDSQDRASTVTFPDGSTSLTAYDPKGNVAAVTDGRGYLTSYSYDALNRRTGSTDALSNRTTLSYDAAGNQTAVQAPLSRTISYAYDSMNRVTTVTDSLAHSTAIGYDSGGNVKTVTDPLNRTTTYSYNENNIRYVVIDPLGNRTTTAYDAAGQVLSVTDPLNRLTTFAYDARGWKANVTDPLGNVTTYSYTATGRTSSIADPASSGGSTDSFSYDDSDRLIAVTDGLGHATSYGYDAIGNRLTITDALGRINTCSYDSMNRLTTVTDPLSHSSVYGYDSGGNRIGVADPLGHGTSTQYDPLNRATTITDARGGVTTVLYDSAGRRTGLTDPVGNRTTWAFDAADRVTTATDALGTATFAYDSADQLTSGTDRAGRRTTFAYDSGGRRTGEQWLNNSGGSVWSITSTYDAAGQLTGVSDPGAVLSFSYDSGGRQVTAQTSGGGTGQPSVTLTSGYDAGGKRISQVDNLAVVGRSTYTYDAARRLSRVDRSFGGVAGPRVTYDYNSADRLTSLSRTIGGAGTAVNTTLAYDSANRLTTLTHQVGGGVGLATYQYTYDNADRLASETNTDGYVTYSYDDTDQLTGVGGARSESYGYDANGNRNTTGYATGAGNTLGASPGYTFGYDAEGNLTTETETATGKVTTYYYDNRDRLIGVEQKTSAGAVLRQVTYIYDALDRRISTDVDGDGAGPGGPVLTWTVYDGRNPYADFDGSGALKERYTHGQAVDALLARTDSGGATAWYLSDRLGTVRDIVSTSGAGVYHAAYGSFGTITSETGTGGDRFKFTGREYDAETGAYYYRARYYDPTNGRFINQDPIEFKAGDPNLYRYVKNNPGNYTDPSGQIFFLPIIVGGLIIGGNAALAEVGNQQAQWVTGDMPLGDYDWSRIAGAFGIGALIGGTGGYIGGLVWGAAVLPNIMVGGVIGTTVWTAATGYYFGFASGIFSGSTDADGFNFGGEPGLQRPSWMGQSGGGSGATSIGGAHVYDDYHWSRAQMASQNSGDGPTNWDVSPGDVSPFPEFWATTGYNLFGGVSGGQYSPGLFGTG